MRPEPEQDTNFYIVGWICAALILTYIGLKTIFHIDIIDYLPACFFHTATGLYCPGCGGTRAAFALARGKLLTSLCYHPFVAYGVAVGGWFMISQTIERLSRGKLRIGMHFRMIYVWIAIGIIALNFLWKNGVLLITGQALL